MWALISVWPCARNFGLVCLVVLLLLLLLLVLLAGHTRILPLAGRVVVMLRVPLLLRSGQCVRIRSGRRRFAVCRLLLLAGSPDIPPS
jgi:hypothetical protein